jgi:hypothetical protein
VSASTGKGKSTKLARGSGRKSVAPGESASPGKGKSTKLARASGRQDLARTRLGLYAVARWRGLGLERLVLEPDWVAPTV